MIENGLEAILIKVAGAGLTEKHLGKTLAEMQPTLHKLVRADSHISGYLPTHILQRDLYQTHVCGEGGEYETLTLNCPVFKRRINMSVASNASARFHLLFFFFPAKKRRSSL